MTIGRLCLAAVALIGSFAPLHAENGRTVLAKGLFSYEAPPG